MLSTVITFVTYSYNNRNNLWPLDPPWRQKKISSLFVRSLIKMFFFCETEKPSKEEMTFFKSEVENVSEDKMLAFSQSIQGRVTFWSECIYEYHQKLMLHYKMTIEWIESFYKLLPGFLFWTIFLFCISCRVHQLLESGTANFIHRFSTKMCFACSQSWWADNISTIK